MLGIFGTFSFAQDAVGTHSLGKGSSSFYHTFVKKFVRKIVKVIIHLNEMIPFSVRRFNLLEPNLPYLW